MHRAGDEVCLALAGELDFIHGARLRDTITRELASRPATLRIDVGTVTFIDCATIATVLDTQAAAAANGIRLVLAHPRGWSCASCSCST